MIQGFGDRFNEALDPILGPRNMSVWERKWRPAAMKEVIDESESPSGFEPRSFAGIGMTCKLVEPIPIDGISEWEEAISDLTSWGKVPDPSSLSSVLLSENDRGPIARLSGDSNWIAEFLPWGSDGLLRRRIDASSEVCDAPCGGFSWEGGDLILIWEESSTEESSRDALIRALIDGDHEAATQTLRECGISLGRYHKHVEPVRTTPPDPNRWNARVAGIEELLRSNSVWRVPHSRDSECMLGLGDVGLADFHGGRIRISRPRLHSALFPAKCEFPAIRDLASVAHDLSRAFYETESDLDIVELRSSLIEGWRSSAPENWSSDRVLYSHRGGLAIWEYEQCLLDVIEAVSHQSGAPQPATGLISYVPRYQKRMFNNRTFGALSMMAGSIGVFSLISSFPPSAGEIPLPIASIALSIGLMKIYRGRSPPPEIPFNRFY
tara:strand:+ start:1880 stop:3190 length:1311 start_codon:yes stop_codon:yes gene_type:complete